MSGRRGSGTSAQSRSPGQEITGTTKVAKSFASMCLVKNGWCSSSSACSSGTSRRNSSTHEQHGHVQRVHVGGRRRQRRARRHHRPGNHRHRPRTTRHFHTYAPDAVRRPRQQADRARRPGAGEGADRQPVGVAALLVGAVPADDRLLGLLHAPDAERRQQGAVVRQEQGEAVVELAEEGHVQGRRRRRRSEGRAPGNHRVPQGAAEVPEARRPHSRRACC